MKFRVPIFFVMLIGSFAYSQDTTINADLTQKPFDQQFNKFIDLINSHHYSSEVKLIQSIFKISHRKFLKNYKAYSQPEDVYKNGNYDCLSGTYFLSNVFDRLGIKYKLIETNYHVFIIAETEHGEILVETTDRFGGIISDQQKIEEKISTYKSFNTVNKTFYLSKFQMYNELPSSKLNGLLYFNKAVALFKKNNLIECSFYLEKAWKIYDNARIESFAPILLKAIQGSNLNTVTKESLSLKLRTIGSVANHTLAVR